jgi:hypothetical protein
VDIEVLKLKLVEDLQFALPLYPALFFSFFFFFLFFFCFFCFFFFLFFFFFSFKKFYACYLSLKSDF